MTSLGLTAVAKPAFDRSERNRHMAMDGYARRTAIFEYAAVLDKQGRTRKARHLRQLSSVIYHGSAATELNLPIAYSGQYREALNAIHGVDIPAWTYLGARHPAINVMADVNEIAFYASGVELLSYDAIAHIRSSRQFQRYLRALGKASEDRESARAADRFQYALSEYIDYLNQPLGSLLVGRYKSWRAAGTRTTISKFVSRGGSASIALTSALDPALGLIGFAASAVWGFAGWAITRWLDDELEEERRAGRSAGVPNQQDVVTVNTSGLAMPPSSGR